MAVVTALVVAFGVLTQILSPSVVLDIVALWPLGALAIPVAVVSWSRRRRSPRSLGLPGLVLVTWLVAGLGLHLSAWSELPSGAADVEGPDAMPITTASMTVEIVSGTLEVGPAVGAALYRLGPLRIGGQLGVPEAFEQTDGAAATVVVGERSDSDWYRFGGWWVQLGAGTRWVLQIAAVEVEADLSGIDLESLAVVARSGSLLLGSPTEDATVSVDGPLRISVPDGVSVLVVGPAVAPPGWARLPDGWASDASGPGWRIEVVNSEAAVEITTR